MAIEVWQQPAGNKALFAAVIKSTGELVTKISTQTSVDKMALATVLRITASDLEAECRSAVRPSTFQGQVSSNICRAA